MAQFVVYARNGVFIWRQSESEPVPAGSGNQRLGFKIYGRNHAFVWSRRRSPATGPTTWTFNVSGGIAFGGSNTIKHIKKYTPSGAITFSGTNVLTKTHVYNISGSVVFSGTATVYFYPQGVAPYSSRILLTGVGK